MRRATLPVRAWRRAGQLQRQRAQAIDTLDALIVRLAVERESLDALGDQTQSLLQLRSREVRAEAVVDAGAEGERSAEVALGRDVERLVAAVAGAVRRVRADQQDGVLRERHV